MKLGLIVIFFITVFNISAFTQEPEKNIYNGGMLIFQPGITITENNQQKIKSFSNGIGGILKFYVKNFYTFGIFGGSSKTNYKSKYSESSYINLGYGGAFVGISKKYKKLRFSVSAFAGPGAIKNLHIQNQNDNILTEAYLYKNSVVVFTPILNLDYYLTERLSFTIQSLILTSKYNENLFYNPTLQLGLLFNR